MAIWVVPEDTWQLDEASEGDVLVRPQQDAVALARVGAQGAEWLGPAPEGVLELTPVETAQRVDDLGVDLEPLLTAMAERGA